MIQSQTSKASFAENNLGQFVLFDWFQFTLLFDYDYGTQEVKHFRFLDETLPIYFFKEIFHIPSSSLEFRNKGINGYTQCYYYKNIECYFNPVKPEMGINYKLSGQGCRDYDELGLEWSSLVELVVNGIPNARVNINRVDIAIDDFTDKYFTLEKLYKYISKGQIVTKFHKTLEIVSRNLEKKNCYLGSQIQLGSKSSGVEITFYDKKLERINNDYIVNDDIEYWTRTELRFRHEYAYKLLFNLFKSNYDLNLTIKGILHNYVRFIHRDDSRKSRCSTCSWWLDYVERVGKLKFNFKYKESDITRKRRWLEEQVSKSNFMVLASKYNLYVNDEQTFEFLKDFLSYGRNKITQQDLDIINDYRIKNKLDILSMQELDSIVADMKELLVSYDVSNNLT